MCICFLIVDSLATLYTLCARFGYLIARPPDRNMAVVYKWFGLVLFSLTCLTVSEARCGGRTVLTDLQGTISDGPSNYPDNTTCEWLINGSYPNVSITITFIEFGTECSFDYLFIYDGGSYLSPLIGAFSGNTLPGTVVAHSGQMLINLYSNTNYSLKGFVANYTIENCTQSCSGNGICVDGFCQCDKSHRGKACDLDGCPSLCSINQGRGECNFAQGHCECNSGYIGESCSLPTLTNADSNKWFTVSSTSSVFSPRIGHSVIYFETSDILLAFGGYSLNEVYADLLQFNFTTSLWSEVHPESPKPAGRFSHSASLYHDSMVLFGGELQDRSVTNELWLYNISVSKWTELAVNDSFKPPPVAEHTATLIDDVLYIFGVLGTVTASALYQPATVPSPMKDRPLHQGLRQLFLWVASLSGDFWGVLRTMTHVFGETTNPVHVFKPTGHTTSDHFSSAMYSYSLSSQTGWEKISYKSGNEDHLRMIGHSTVYYADMRSIIVFGGFVPKGARVSDRSNKLLAFHVDLQVWSELAAVTPDSDSVPQGHAFHSAVLVGDYMIIYGGNIHQTCYNNSLFFYHLKCQKWISSDIFQALSPSSSSTQLRGRFSHQVVPRNGSVLLVVGGFSGQPLGDVLGYKLPTAIIADKNSTGGQCASYNNVEKSCKDDPDCGWCSTDSKCFSRAQSGSCGVSLKTGSCPGLCAVFKQCGTCLSFGSTTCGWCVQDSSCYPTGSPTGACQTVNNNNRESLRGWWGDSGLFLTSFNQCQSSDHPPGITVVENQMYPLSSFPDNVMIALKTEVWVLRPSTVQLIGYIYPYKYLSSPWRDYGVIFSISNFASGKVEVWLSTDDTEANQELVGSCKDPFGGDCLHEHLQRSSNQRLFPSQAEDKRYFIKVIINKTSSQDGGNSHFTLSWNRTSLGSGISSHETLSAQFLQPYSSSDCSGHKSCLACMTNANCGWCVTACMSRNAGSCFDSSGKHLTLNQTECTVCSDYVDCSSCNQGSNCVWGASKGLTLGCYQRGQKLTTVHEDCSSPCLSRKTCESCLSDRVGCTWCDKTQSCFVFGTYTSLYPYGQCSHWIDSYHGGQCSNCSQHTNCQSCLRGDRCGWCGKDNDPRIGRCFSGDFVAPYNGQCPNIFPTNGSTIWSYSECPDVDECKLGIAQCHKNATCNNSPGSFQCICKRGFTGDGTTACNKTCFHDCGEHGDCGVDYKCKCHLGWLGENCSTDCGCNGHSDCSQGIGICDKCQENTQGDHCEFCIPGSYGNATTSLGCKSCHCNGHGDPKQNVCDMETGKCFCTEFTLGHNCSVCMPGLLGNPENGGICFHECKTRSILTNITQGYISTEKGSGVSVRSKASCLWVISSLSNASHGVIYGPSPPPVGNRGRISLTFKEIRINCLTDHVDVYDGLPPFSLGPSPVESFQSFRRLGSFCGWNATKLKPVTALLGNMVVVMTADLSTGALSQKFSAKFEVTKCPGLCGDNRKCIVTSDGERCVCLEGWTGANCDQLVCPKNCSVSQGQGNCNLTLGHCVCTSGFIGPDCSQTLTIGTGLWEKILADLPRPNITVSHVARLGHSMVHGPGYLLVFAGYSTSYGLLDDILSFNVTSNTWSVIEVNQLPSDVPSARYLHSAVFHGDSMLVYGGQTKNGADQSLWQFNVTTLRWTKEMTSHGLNVAGHTATLAEDEMVLIGGYDKVSGFTDKTYKYNVLTKQWSQVQTTGPYPKGLYGHTTVYYATKSVMLVFGGYRFRIDSVMPSDALYSLDLNSRKWSILQPLPRNEPRPKYFHSAAILDDVMIVYGGRSNTTDQLFSSELLLYNIKCNYWYLLPDNSLLGSKPEALMSATAAKVADRIFIFGGFNGEAHGTLFRLTLPSDLCQALTSKEKCNAVNICSWCEVHNVTQERNLTVATNQSACYSVTSPVPAVCHAEPNVTQVIFHNGTNCSAPSTRSCGTFYSCSTCLASYPHPNTKPSCSWCTRCSTGGKCIKPTETCHEAHPCVQAQEKQQQVDLCSFNGCEASSCTACLERGQCMWTTQLKWLHERQLGLSLSTNDPYSWNCYTSQIDEKYLNVMRVTTSPLDCPQSCSVHTSCTTCLASNGLVSVAHARLKKLSTFRDAPAEQSKEFDPDDAPLPNSSGDGGWKECAWSETLGQCFSLSYLPIICLAGQCGRVIRGSTSDCMGSCGAHQQCSYCLNSYNCGWCAEQGTEGKGQCFEGGIQGPLNNTCTANSVSSNVTHVWASTLCPLENECENGRSNCDPITQLCVDTPEAYRCVCKQGYDDTADPGTCVPVCSKGCDHGRCVRPEVCVCNFGWTSANCSVKCLCNEHGQCANETHLDVCHDCRNHTVGRSCEFCEPLYVGDARDNGSCVSCYNECSHRADVCMNVSQLEYGQTRNLSFEPAEVKKWLKQGPFKIEREEECLCKNNSNGFRCGSCVYGFFEHEHSCTSCLCNGHADTCDKKEGTCKCENNTEEDCSPSFKDCYKRQCSKCKENFMGSPVNSQQCYRKINVMQEFVIGQQTGDDRNIQALPYGQSIFYGIYPRFTNVDIRLTVDVFTGEVDVYVTSENDVFTVKYNQTSGHHEVLIRPFAGKRKRRSVDDTSGQDEEVDTVTASDKRLNTFITYNEGHQALIVRQVRKRLVLTFPHSQHFLKDDRFYMVFVGRSKPGTKGLVYFRQDLSQIDLFVFFSVFFSAFFLVVSVSVFGWKIKQYHTRRRVIEHREMQLESMRSRPFATYSLLHQKDKPQPSCWRIKRDAAGSKEIRFRDTKERPVLAPVSQEPAVDGRASVTTVVFQLPANECTELQLMFGSALTWVSNQQSIGFVNHHVSNGRKTSTRRTVTFTS